jgi:hypothetical protein
MNTFGYDKDLLNLPEESSGDKMLDDIDNVFRVDELRSNNMHLRM